MINHGRTLLLNKKATGEIDVSTTAGSHAIDPDFKPIKLTASLTKIYGILFGTAPDDLMLNYRSSEYLSILYAADLDFWLRALDARITYDPTERDERLFYDAFLPTYEQTTNGEQKRLFFFDQHSADEIRGRLQGAWTVSIDGDAGISIRSATDSSAADVAEAMSLDLGLSQLLYLPGSSLGIRLENCRDTAWSVRAAARPRRTLVDVFNQLDLLLRSEGAGVIFSGSVEPFTTAQNLWVSHLSMVHKLAGILLAYIYTLENIRLKGS